VLNVMKAQRLLVLALAAVLGSSAAATAQTSLTGRTITQLRVGDYVLPRFSPSGRLLAISQVLADSAGENTQILILDMRRGVLDTLLAANAAAKYAVYKAYVSALTWLGDTALIATIPDGDVDAAVVTLSLRARRIIREDHLEAGLDEWPPLLADSLAHLYPEVAPSGVSPSAVFGSGLSWPTVRGRGFVLLQKRHAGVDDDVWLYRLDRREAVRVLRQAQPASADLRGGFVAGQDVIFAVGSDTVTLYRLRSGRLRALTRIPARPQQSGLALRAGPRSGDAWFIVTAHPPYERGHNPAFWYDGERLLPLADYAELADFDVHLPTRRIAFVYWEGVQRHLAVKELLTR